MEEILKKKLYEAIWKTYTRMMSQAPNIVANLSVLQ